MMKYIIQIILFLFTSRPLEMTHNDDIIVHMSSIYPKSTTYKKRIKNRESPTQTVQDVRTREVMNIREEFYKWKNNIEEYTTIRQKMYEH